MPLKAILFRAAQPIVEILMPEMRALTGIVNVDRDCLLPPTSRKGAWYGRERYGLVDQRRVRSCRGSISSFTYLASTHPCSAISRGGRNMDTWVVFDHSRSHDRYSHADCGAIGMAPYSLDSGAGNHASRGFGGAGRQ